MDGTIAVRAAAAGALIVGLAATSAAPAPLDAQEEAPESEVKTEVRMVRAAGREAARSGWLGVRVEDVDDEAAGELGLDDPRGARVTGVEEDAPAASAGLREGDLILRFDGEEIRSVAHLVRLVRETPSGRDVELRVLRDGDRRNLTVEVGHRPSRGFRVHVGGPDLDGLDEARLEEIRERAHRVRELWEHRMERMGDEMEHVAPHVRMMRFGGPPRLGVRMQELPDQLAEHFGVADRGGVLVASVREGSPAADAGLEAGDVIVRFDARDVEDPGDLAEAVHEAEAGPVEVTVVRDGAERSLTADLPESGEGGWWEDDDGRTGGVGRVRPPGAPVAPPAPPTAPADDPTGTETR